AFCRIVEATATEDYIALPTDALAFLRGGPPPPSFSCSFWAEPTWLRFTDRGQGDPKWVRPMGMEPLYAGPNGRIGGRLNYGWLVCGWEIWGEGQGNPFAEKTMEIPILATKSVDFEFALMPNTSSPSEDGEPDREWLERVVGDEVIAPDNTL